jgi:hypothetical protein
MDVRSAERGVQDRGLVRRVTNVFTSHTENPGASGESNTRARELAQIMVDQKAIATLESYAAGLEAEAARLEAQAQEFPAQAMAAPTGGPSTITEAIAALKSEPEGPQET